ncbi:cAMP responsive element modulator b isoform X2 [Triplophysa dalaica]|uniref:cAMP responsive element modulator b isoform X2 n=1 Tax=Triplophysa dalaica TaxID=1582913 RepID=UPI0024DF6B97|nr:cAMP responsive element modulator b isoform X2 [Triplophysa dalaica]
MASGNACAQTLLGSSFPAVTRDHLSVGQMIKVKSDMQASWVECKDDQCDDLPESPEKRRLPSRCTASYLKGLLNDQPEKQMYDSGSGGGLYQTSAGSYNSVNWSRSIHMIPSQQTYQTVKMTSGGNRCPGTPMMPYTVHSGDGIQTYIMPDSKVAVQAPTGDMSAYEICSPTSGLSQEMGSSPGSVPSPKQLSEEASRKRELRMIKNREAARECRRKKKEYVKCLENRVAVLENQNKTLIEELKALKVLYSHKTE